MRMPVAVRPPTTSASKSSSVPSSGWMAVCPPSAAPIAQGTPGSPRTGLERVVRALAERAPDGVDRRQVEDVEAEVGDVRQARDDVAERAVAAGLRRGGAREELVPGREAGVRRIDRHRERRLPGRLEAPVGVRDP